MFNNQLPRSFQSVLGHGSELLSDLEDRVVESCSREDGSDKAACKKIFGGEGAVKVEKLVCQSGALKSERKRGVNDFGREEETKKRRLTQDIIFVTGDFLSLTSTNHNGREND